MALSSWQSNCENSPGSFDEYRMAPSGRQPKTKPDDLGCESACTCCQKLHPPSPFIIITQPESWYSFYRPTEGRRLSRPGWLVTHQKWFTRPQTVTHLGTNRVWRRATTLIESNALAVTRWLPLHARCMPCLHCHCVADFSQNFQKRWAVALDYAIKFARWQHPVVERRARSAPLGF